MKKLLSTFFVASIVIAGALSLSSCKKDKTNVNGNEEWIPTVFTSHLYNPDAPTKDDNWIICDYGDACNYSLHRVHLCTHGYYAWTPLNPDTPLCSEHYHFHLFTASDDCCPPGTDPSSFLCPYRWERLHQHVISYSIYWTDHNDHHVGGGSVK